MNKLLSEVSENRSPKAILAVVILLILIFAALGFLFALFVLIVTYFSQSLGELPLCFSSSCISYWTDVNSSVFSILSATGIFITGVVTIGGIVVALLSYQNSVSYASVSNHLSHLNLFMAYVSNETARRPLLARSNVESLKWYNLIYSESIRGSFVVSNEYVRFITGLNAQIGMSNQKYVNANAGETERYRYKIHQQEMIGVLNEVGVYLEGLPRIEFNEVEIQVLDLISTINKSFCRDHAIPDIYKRGYH